MIDKNPIKIRRIILIPEAKTIMVQVEIIKKVCPMSGWLTNKKTIKDKIWYHLNIIYKASELATNEIKAV